MNQHQMLNNALEILLGLKGRAVWLAVRVDNKNIAEVAREHKLTFREVKDMLATGDYAIEKASLVRPAEDKNYKPNLEGFHQTEDAL